MSDDSGRRVWDYVFKAMVPIGLAAGGMVVAHEVRLTRMEANAFTVRDGRQLETKMADTPWLKESIAEIKQLLREQDKRLRAIENRVAQLPK